MAKECYCSMLIVARASATFLFFFFFLFFSFAADDKKSSHYSNSRFAQQYKVRIFHLLKFHFDKSI